MISHQVGPAAETAGFVSIAQAIVDTNDLLSSHAHLLPQKNISHFM